jgi:hypothetical protein
MAFPERLTLRAMWITVRNSSDFPMHPLHATLEEFATEGYTHQLPRCCVRRLRAIAQLAKISMGLTKISTRLRWADCGGYRR